MKTTKEIGDYGERIAVRYLLLHGYLIKARNYRCGKYEIDIIASTPRDVVFVEVKTRSYLPGQMQDAPPPGMAVDPDKQRFTRSAAAQYLRKHPSGKQPRMDVFEVWLEKREDGKRPRVLRKNHIKAAY